MGAHADSAWQHRADLHFHLLPALDDGPKTLAESIELARAAVTDGTGTVVATPHVKPEFVSDVYELPDRVRELQAALQAEGIPLAVRRGAEVGHEMVGRLSQAEIESIALGPPGARWLLLEAPFDGLLEGFQAAVDELRDRGFASLIAHPERSPALLENGAAALRRELDRGALAQVNAGSLEGQHGPGAEGAGFELVESGLAAAIASDAHGGARPPALSRSLARLVAHGIERRLAHGLVSTGPRRVLARGIATRPNALAA
jgi:protein-tyrosine phosphatase